VDYIGFGTRYAGGLPLAMLFQAWQLPSLKAVIGFFIGGLIMAYLIFL
jgi:hypothetical protein